MIWLSNQIIPKVSITLNQKRANGFVPFLLSKMSIDVKWGSSFYDDSSEFHSATSLPTTSPPLFINPFHYHIHVDSQHNRTRTVIRNNEQLQMRFNRKSQKSKGKLLSLFVLTFKWKAAYFHLHHNQVHLIKNISSVFSRARICHKNDKHTADEAGDVAMVIKQLHEWWCALLLEIIMMTMMYIFVWHIKPSSFITAAFWNFHESSDCRDESHKTQAKLNTRGSGY